MSFATLCAACSLGEHSKHDGEHHGLPGLIGGTYCPCEGDCKPPPWPFPTPPVRSSGADENGAGR